MSTATITARPWPRPELFDEGMIWARIVGELRGTGDLHRVRVNNAAIIHIIVSGHGGFWSKNGEFAIGPGDSFCVWPEIQHEFWEKPDDPFHYFWVRIDEANMFDVVRDIGFSSTFQVKRPANPVRAIRCVKLLYQHYEDPDFADPYQAAFLLMGVLASFRQAGIAGEPRSPTERLVEQAKALVEHEYASGINVSQLAERLQVTRQALFAAFREELKQSPAEFIQYHRLHRAKFFLSRTSLKVGAVGRMVGYGHEKYFFRRFRELTGMTPTEYRRSEECGADR